MISISGSLWPYVLISIVWVALCGWLLLRAWRARPAGEAPAAPSRTSRPSMQDSQAGRI